MANCVLPSDSSFFTVDEIYCAIRHLKTNKAIGNCNISSDVLRLLNSEVFCSLLRDMFNVFTKQGLPSAWS